VIVAVKDDRRVVADSRRTHQTFELLFGQDVPAHLLAELRLPVPADRPTDMALFIGRSIDIHLDDADAGIIQVLREPFGAHEHFRMCIFCHGSLPP
jgi:hypothetical protein